MPRRPHLPYTSHGAGKNGGQVAGDEVIEIRGHIAVGRTWPFP